MIEINLLKKRYLLPAQRRERLLFFLGIFIPVLLFSLLMLLVVYSVNKAIVSSYATRVEKQQEALREEMKRMFTPSADEQTWQEELRNVVGFQEKYPRFSSKMVILADLVPATVYFTGLDLAEGGITIEGQGLPGNQTLSSIALFLEKINRNEVFLQDTTELRIEEIRESDQILNFRIASEPREQ